jgi:serine/threonine protein kinase
LLKTRQKLGKYRIEGRIADGHLAAVYRAFDTIHETRVALKVPQVEASSEFYLQDFRREARLSTKLAHANIMPIRDASIIDGHFVIAMPLGVESLKARMKRRLSTETALNFADQALAAVAFAHENKVVHCDIKPANFIVFPDNELRLTDFAISKLAKHTLRASGSGTVGYIAPEQAVGRPMFQSDVFSLGLLIYEMLSGHLPEWPYKWPPSGIERVRAKVSPSLVAWLRRAIEVRPEKRFKNAVVMHREFKKLLKSANGSTRTKRKTKRHADPSAWQDVLFKQFQLKYRSVLDTRHECPHCSGPIAEIMTACPWCGSKVNAAKLETSFPAECPRCSRGSKLDWRYCPWCYGSAFEVETTRSYSDKRYTHRCSNKACKGDLMPFMHYCPWCHTKVQRAWKLEGSRSHCPSCHWGVDLDFWHHCPWCAKTLE